MPKAASHAMAEAANVAEAAQMGETAASEMGDAYAMVETHAVMGDRPVGAHAHVPEAMIGVTAKYSRVAVAIAVRIAVVIAKIIRACIGAAVSRIVDGAGWASVRAGIGLGSSRLRSSKCSDGEPNANRQQDQFGRKLAADHRSLLWGFARQFKLIPKWDLGGICGAASSEAAPRYWQKFWPGAWCKFPGGLPGAL